MLQKEPTLEVDYPTPAGFEPTQDKPNGFQVHRLNHSATVSLIRMLSITIYEGKLSVVLNLGMMLGGMPAGDLAGPKRFGWIYPHSPHWIRSPGKSKMSN